ncbi:hypothetical protein KQX54_015669 [Cotesia glomerata]|uniref:CCHC-type domain-containing protein n=1 Tax=Cotesia glomerata TaxID=32391 RepID=A0AAV7J7T7_COTGL|nr:hypothetical protein KQX54_015669 [Cotesia glomerata]
MDGYDWGTPVERGTEEWWRIAIESLRVKAWVLRKFRPKKELPSGCAFCGIKGHAARFCKNSAQKNLPFCTECNVFVEGGRCIGDHGDFRSLVRGRCMICHTPRTSQRGQCTQCGRSVVQQLRDCPHAMDIIEENVTAAHSREKLGLPDWELVRFREIGEVKGWNGIQRLICGSGISHLDESMDSSPQTDRSIVKTDPVHNYSPAMDQTWLMTGLELPTSQLRLFLCGLGLSSKGNLETLHDRLIRHLEYKYEVPGVHWDPTVDEVRKLTEIVVDINQTSQSSIQSSCEDLIERVDEILSSSSRLIQELASSGGFSKHESFESLDVTPQRELVTYPSISEEEVLNSDGSYSAHKDELVNDPSSTVDGVVLDHASKTAGPPMDNDGESVNFESSMDQIVTRRDLDVAVRKLESKIENCFTQLQQVIMDKMMTRVNNQEDTSQVVNDQKSESQCDSGVDCETQDVGGDLKSLKDSNKGILKRRRRGLYNRSKKSSDGTTSNDEATYNLTTKYTNRGNASSEVNALTSASDSGDRNDCSSESKSEFIKKRRRRRRRPSEKTKTSRASLVANNVVGFSQSTRGNTNRRANGSGESAFGSAWSKSAVETRLTRRHGTCVKYPDQMSQREKDGRPSSYVYSPVFNRYGHSRVDPRRYVQENRFGVQYELANHFVGSRWEAPCCCKSDVPRGFARNHRIDCYPVPCHYPYTLSRGGLNYDLSRYNNSLHYS